MTTPTPTSDPAAPASARVRGAYATLDRADQRLIDAVLFDGRTCVQLARSADVEPRVIRRQLGAAMLELHAALGRDREADRGTVATMVALRALDALDTDESEVVDALLAHHPALLPAAAGHGELVGELCLMVPRIAPDPGLLLRLLRTAGADHALHLN